MEKKKKKNFLKRHWVAHRLSKEERIRPGKWMGWKEARDQCHPRARLLRTS
jgi:hypothetical protein